MKLQRVAVLVPFVTNVNGLVATFRKTGANVKVGAIDQISGITANNFTNSVRYTVTALDGTTADYTVTVTVVIFKLPDTGQTGNYPELFRYYSGIFGEDLSYNTNSPSYVDNGNGTITDNNTTLMWQKEDDNVVRPWADAITYCDELNLGGYSDWRLPTSR